MTPSRQDVSLYELALSAETTLHPLQISPTTFKSLVGNVLDLLVDRHVAAQIWLKLPKGEVWTSMLDRYRRLCTASHTLYTFKVIKKEDELLPKTELAGLSPSAAEGEPDEEEAEGLSLINDNSAIAPPLLDGTTNTLLPLSPDSQLRREYFLMVVAEGFHCVILAHRPRSVKVPKAEASVKTRNGMVSPSGFLVDEDVERKHPLLGICSFEQVTLQRVLGGLVQAAQAGAGQGCQPESNPLDLESLIQHWQAEVAKSAETTLNPMLLSHLFIRQMQRQEEIWHSGAYYRKQAEEASELRMTNEELLNAVRLKDEFLKNVGQELRTPLSTMKTALSLLNSPNIKPGQRQRYMEMLSQECDRQSSLITSVLDLLQLENVNDQTPLQPIRLMDVVPGVVSTYQPLAQEKGVMLAYTIPEDLPTVACFSSSLRQIVINLLHNGIKFTPNGGQVWVRAKQQGDYIQLEFRDTGIGIDQAEIPRIFDRFYRIRVSGEDSGGAGLGLSIVQQLLLRIGGSISVRSKPGEGSTFSVMLPVYHAG